jgi:hypothetical protein
MNYTTLTEQIKSYANRADDAFIKQIPNFIEQGINRLYSEAKNIGFEIIFGGDLAINQTTIKKPVNWRETISFELYSQNQTFSKFLLPRSYEFCKSYWPNQTLTAEPSFYANYNDYNKFYLSPTVDKQYKYKLIYLGVPFFNKTNDENFLTQRYPRLLFYSCMLEAMPFLRDDERLAVFEGLYSNALADINSDTTARYNDRTTNRNKS